MPSTPPHAGDARRLASGSLMQQLSQVAGLAAMFTIITVLARRLTLSELGVFGVLNALAGYLLVVQNAGAAAAVREMAAGAGSQTGRQAYSTAFLLYCAAGMGAGLLVAGGGRLLADGLNLAAGVQEEARSGALLLGLVTAAGWPATIHRDALRARGRFILAAQVELVALFVYGALVIGLASGGASLRIVIAAGGSIPLLVGLGCWLATRATNSPYRLRRAELSRDAAVRLMRLGAYVTATEASIAAVFNVNRAILGLFGSAATVGLFEGPVRAHNLLRALGAATTVTVLPSAAGYFDAGDEQRLRELALRGSRYLLALMLPLVATGAALGAPLLELWLGDDYGEAGIALGILVGHWAISAPGIVLGTLLVGIDQPRALARWGAAVTAVSIGLALALVPSLEIEGVALAVSLPYVLFFPMVARPALRSLSISVTQLVRAAYLPALAVAVPVGLVQVAARMLDTDAAVLSAAVGGPVVAWAAYVGLCMSPAERRLVRSLLPVRRA